MFFFCAGRMVRWILMENYNMEFRDIRRNGDAIQNTGERKVYDLLRYMKVWSIPYSGYVAKQVSNMKSLYRPTSGTGVYLRMYYII